MLIAQGHHVGQHQSGEFREDFEDNDEEWGAEGKLGRRFESVRIQLRSCVGRST